MKKLIIVTLVVISVAAVAFGQQVLSRNAVGYQQISLQKGRLAIVRHDFEELDTYINVSNVFANLPVNSKIHLYQGSTYNTVTKTALFNWGAGGSNRLDRGQSFWVEIPATAASNFYQVFMMGEVPDRFSATDTVVAVRSGLTMAGYGYPVDVYWTNTSLAKMAPINSKIHIWAGTNYVSHTKTALFGWGSAGNAQVITPGMGFWCQWAAATNWTEVKPYTWP